MKTDRPVVMRTVFRFFLAAVALAFALTGCGGGGGGASAPATVPNITSGSEGTSLSPILAQVGTPRASTVGVFTSSYYMFTPTVGGTYVISLSSPTNDIRWTLYSDSGLTNSVSSCNNYSTATTESCPVNLQPNTTYYLVVSAFSLSATTTSFTLGIDLTVNEGSTTTPVNLTVGTAHAGSVALSGMSYYVFTPSTTGAYTLAISNASTYASLALKVFSTAFTSASPNLLLTCGSGPNPSCTANGLSAGVPYYVRVDGNSTTGASYNILVSPGVSEGAVANPLALVVGAVAHNGAADAFAASYYQFTTGSSGEYIINVGGSTAPTISVYSGADFASGYLGSCNPGTPCSLSGLNASQIYYVKVGNPVATDITYQIRVTQGITEGSAINPVLLTVGAAAHSATIAASGTAYYSFQTTAFAGSYTIGLANTQRNLAWTLYDDAGFTVSKGNCNNITTAGPGDESCVTTNLDPNRMYYFKVTNNETTGSSTYNVAVIAGGGSEGTLSYPVPLTLGTPHAGGVLASGNSYYSFATGAVGGLTHVATLIGPTSLQGSINLRLYSDSGFSSIIASCWPATSAASIICSTQGSYSQPVLSANTTYYAQVSSSTVASTYNATVTALDPALGCSAGSAECFNFENGALPTGFLQTSVGTTGTKWQWGIDGTNPAGSGTTSLATGTVGFQQQGCFQYQPINPSGSVTFSFRTTMTNDNVELDISSDGGTSWTYNMWSAGGATPWRRVVVPTYMITGTSLVFRWCHMGHSLTSTTEVGWVDDIEFR